MVFKLVGNGLKAPLVGAAAFNAIKNVQLRGKLAAKYDDIRDTYDDMITSFKANKPEKEKQGIDLFLQLPPLIKEYNDIIKKLADKAVQGKVAAVLGPIIENYGKIKEALDTLASEDSSDAQVKKPVDDADLDQATTKPKPSPVEISEQTEHIVKQTKPVAKPSFARLATKALAKATDASEWISQGKALMVRGDIETARDCFAKAVELAPWSADALFYHGSACFQTGDTHGAQKSLDAAVARYKKALEKQVLQDRPDIIRAMQANVVSSVEMLSKIANPTIGEESSEGGQELDNGMEISSPIEANDESIKKMQEDTSSQSSDATQDEVISDRETDARDNQDDTVEKPLVIEANIKSQDSRKMKQTTNTQEINFTCGGCGRFYRIKAPDVNLVYACSECGTPLNRVFRCPHCKQAMALPQDQFKQIVNIEIPCVYCNEPFKP